MLLDIWRPISSIVWIWWLLATQEDLLHVRSHSLPTSTPQQKLMLSDHVNWSHLNTLASSVAQEILNQSHTFYVPCNHCEEAPVLFLHRARHMWMLPIPRGPLLYPSLDVQLESPPKEHLEAETILKLLVPFSLFNLWMLLRGFITLKMNMLCNSWLLFIS